VGFTGYVTKQTFVSSKCQVVYVEECVTQAAFESFMEKGINPGFVTLRQLTSIGWQCIADNRLNN